VSRKFLSALLAGVLAIACGSVAYGAPSTTPPVVDPATPANYSLGDCLTPEQLDCVQGVVVQLPSGVVEEAVTARAQEWVIRTDARGNQIYEGQKFWKIPSTGVEFTTMATLETPAYKWENRNSPSVMWAHIGNFHKTEPGTVFQIQVRTSWIRPQNLQLKANNAYYSHSVIPGGNLWTFSGTPAMLSNYTSWAGRAPGDWSARADVTYPMMSFVVHHAGADSSTSFWDPRCAHTGFTVQSFNAPGAGSPEWDNATASMRFNIGAPHLDASGNQNIGFFRLWIPEAFMECQWPENNLVASDNLTARILNEDGSVQDAGVYITKENGMIYLDAWNFHYSEPTFEITAGGSEGTPRTGARGILKPTSPKASSPTKSASPSKSSAKPTGSAAPTPSSSPTTDETDQVKGAENQAASEKTSEPSSPAPFIALGIGMAAVSAGVAAEVVRRRKKVAATKKK
jgi:hypothetical protein